MTKSNETYDIVLANGRVIDPETYLDGKFYVGINGGSIAAVSETPLEGKEVVDAKGMIVSPGFIDMHAHGDDIPAGRMQAFDGVTTVLDLELGRMPVSEWYDNCAKEGRPTNYGISVAWMMARQLEFNPEIGKPRPDMEWMASNFKYSEWVNTLADGEQIASIAKRLEEGINEGAIGIGLPYGYMPAAGDKEMVAICQMAAEYRVPTFTHIQNFSVLDPKSSVSSYVKVIGLAAATGAHMHICHLNSTSSRDVDLAAPLIQSAIDAGLPISLGAYTYGAAESAISAAEWDPSDVRERLGVDWSDFTLVRNNKSFSSKEELEAAIKKEPGSLVIVHFLHEEEDSHDQALLDISVLFPGGVIETDSFSYNLPDGKWYHGKEWPLPEGLGNHPRSAGCYGRFLRKWVRERGVISWIDAIRKASLNPAKILEKSTLQFKKKGRIQVGADADIIVFDPETVAEQATFQEPCQTTAGMKHVLVNGTFLIRDEQLDTEAFPGKPVRRPISS
jgi:N-acyl-D-glutamate deacylase